MKLSIDRNTADSRFVYFALLSPAVQHALHGSTMSAGVPHINLGTFRQLRLIVPTPAAQRRVSEILGAIDDLIENNRRRIEVLEQMAQAIYREWFVHFRYPGHEDSTFVDSPLGPIPDGWEVRPLRAMATLDRTSAQPGRFPHEEFDHFSIPAFDDGALPAVDVGDTIKSGKFLVSTSAVLVSKLNPRIERTWFAEPAADRRSVASTEFLVLRPLLGFSLEFVYLTVRSERFQDRLRALSGGTSTSHQRAKPDDFLEIDVLQPPVSAVLRFTEFSAPQLRMGRTLRVESRQLAALRDLLLPKLVTGQIDVSNLDLDALVDSTA
jgi:type I restriction enzyme S subunit